MPWVRFDDQFPDHHKVRGLSDAAYRLHNEAIFWCARQLTDGFIPEYELRNISHISRPYRHINALLSRHLWITVEGGWRIHDYLDYQPSKAQVKARREVRAEAGRKGGIASGETRRGEANSQANASRLLEPRPVPSRLSTSVLDVCRRLHEVDARVPADDDGISATMDSWHREFPRADLNAEAASWLAYNQADLSNLRRPLAAWRAWLRKAERRAAVSSPGPPPIYALCGHGKDGSVCPWCKSQAAP